MLMTILATMNAVLLASTALILFKSASAERRQSSFRSEQRQAENAALGERLERLQTICDVQARAQKRLEFLMQRASEGIKDESDTTLAQCIIQSGGSVAELSAATELNPAEIDLLLRLNAAKGEAISADMH